MDNIDFRAAMVWEILPWQFEPVDMSYLFLLYWCSGLLMEDPSTENQSLTEYRMVPASDAVADEAGIS